MTLSKISVAIFSYNRGDYVENCLSSVMQCMPDSSVTIYDDGSDELSTQQYLQGLGSIVVHCIPTTGAERHGGLYENMQRALQEAKSEYILFLQDDMQLVRPVDYLDIECLDHFFYENKNSAFVNPVFLKGHRRKSIDKQLSFNSDLDGYYQSIPENIKPRPVSMYYCDVVIASVSRLREKKWNFLFSETGNASLARANYSKMLQMASPFAMHIPEVPIYRNKIKTYGSRLANKKVGSKLKKYCYMSGEQISALRSRDKCVVFPYAEDFLQTENPNVKKPYQYSAVNIRWYTRALHKIEYKTRLLFVNDKNKWKS